MFLVTEIAWLFLVGLVGIAPWMATRRPQAKEWFDKLTAYEGWIGLVGGVYGLWNLIYVFRVTGRMWGEYSPKSAVFLWLFSLIGAALLLVAGTTSAMPLVQALLGASSAQNSLTNLQTKLTPLKAILGFLCLGTVWLLWLFFLIAG